MALLDMNTFFKVNGNLTKISWDHAVNNHMFLKQVLSSNIMMLEADVVIGNHTKANLTNIPIMAHPPANTSDLSLENFLNVVQIHNSHNNPRLVKKGIKLDFKTIEALEASIPIIEQLYAKMTYPVWFNADILPGPCAAKTTPVDPARFFSATRNFVNSILSIGWTTRYGLDINCSYTDSDIRDMLSAIKDNNVTQRITFPVRAGIAASSFNQIKDLVSNVPQSTLTIWSNDSDPVNVTNLKALIHEIGINRTFVDVPKILERQLKL